MRLVTTAMVTMVKVGLKPGQCFPAFPSLLPRTVISQTKGPCSRFHHSVRGGVQLHTRQQAQGCALRPAPTVPSTDPPAAGQRPRRPCRFGPWSLPTLLSEAGGSNT